MTSPLGFGIIGTGNIARVHALALSTLPDISLRAVHDRSPERGASFAAEFRCDHAAELDALLSRADIDAVCVTTPSGAHRDVVIAALRAGKHVLCEKPLELTTERIDAMLAAARESGRILATVFQLRLGAGAQRLHAALRRGAFGQLSLCSAYVKWWREPSYYEPASWRGTAAMDGGVLMNQGIHAVDLLQWLVGSPTQVTARARTRLHAIEMEDTVAALLEYPNGMLGVLEATTCAYPGLTLRLEITGSRGSAVLEDDRLATWKFAEPEAMATPETDAAIVGGSSDPRAIGTTGHQRTITDFVGAVRCGHQPLLAGTDGRSAVSIIEAVYESARRQAPVAPR